MATEGSKPERREPTRYGYSRRRGMVANDSYGELIWVRGEDYDDLARENEELRADRDALRAQLAEVAAQEREACLALIPTNWCDSMLTGPDGINVPAGCPDVEKLLLRIAAAIRARGHALTGAGEERG